MKRVVANVKKFAKDKKGATIIEYAIIASLIAVVAIGSLTAFSTSITDTFTNITKVVNEKVKTAAPATN